MGVAEESVDAKVCEGIDDKVDPGKDVEMVVDVTGNAEDGLV